MKFSIDRGVLDGALRRVAPFAEPRSPIPIIGCIKMVATENILSLSATDTDAIIAERLPLMGAEPGSICIEAGRLRSLVGSLRAKETVELWTDKSQLRIVSGHTKAAFETWQDGDFPEFGTAFPDPQIRVSAGELDRVLAMTVPVMGTDNDRAYLCGLSLNYERDGISAAASDGRRGAVFRLAHDGLAEFPAIILPRPVCGKLRSLLKGANGAIQIAITPTRARLSTGEWSVITKLIDGNFPDHNRWMAQLRDTPVLADSDELSDILARIESAVDMDNAKLKQRGAHAEIGDGVMKLTGGHGAIRDQMTIEYSGPPIEVGFNTSHFREAVSALDSKQVEIHLLDAVSPIRVCVPEETEENFTIMPYRV